MRMPPRSTSTQYLQADDRETSRIDQSLSRRPSFLALCWFQKKIAHSGRTTTGVTMAQTPRPHRQPGPARAASAMGPPLQVVKMKGEVAKDSIRDRFLRDVVSDMKTVRQ